jgi:ABC-type dipeptide/oligopeptide/nickel transport system permease subunit
MAVTTAQKLFRNKNIFYGTILFSFFVLCFLVSFVWTPYAYNEVFDGMALQPFGGQFWFGTDDLGRDLFSRLMIGCQFSLGIGLVVGGIAVVIGAGLGLISGYYGKRVDQILNQTMNALQAMPSLLLALFVVAILGPSVTNTIISVTLVSIPTMFRLVRSQCQVEMSK